jgi:hypothetical protein
MIVKNRIEEVTRDAGDALYPKTFCPGVRASGSRSGFGIISMRTRGLHHDGIEIMSWYRSAMPPKRASGIGHSYFPVAVNGPLTRTWKGCLILTPDPNER